MASDSTRLAYDSVAADYEDRFLNELDHKPRDRELLDGLAAVTTDIVLEIGCGPGQVGAYLQSRGCRVVGFDLSPEMAVRAATRLSGAVTADMLDLPVRSHSIGAIVAFYSVIHLPRSALVAAFRGFAGALRPGGRLLVSAHEGNEEVELSEFLGKPVKLSATLFTLGELRTAATDAGLTVVVAERRQPYASEGGTVRLYLQATAP